MARKRNKNLAPRRKRMQRVVSLRKAEEEENMQAPIFESDDYFYFIAGYTSGGVPYGITWEEAEHRGLTQADEENDVVNDVAYMIAVWDEFCRVPE